MKSILIVSIFGFLWKNVFAQNFTYTCVPETDCMMLGYNGALVPDPVNCEYYYKCLQTGPTTFEPNINPTKCPEGQYFDQTHRTCSNETTPGTCKNACLGNQSPGCSGFCPPYDGLLHYVAVRGCCYSYYACLTTPVLLSCPPEAPYFNGIYCDTDISQCCNPCVPVCSSASYQIVDPCDCTSFYFCIDGVPSDKTSCGPGYHYDETVNNCAFGPCTTECSSSECGNSVVSESACDSVVATTTTGKPPATTTTPPPDGCTPTSSFSCPSNGNFPRCPYCANSFFHCANNVATVSYCLPNEVFNTNLGYPYCLAPQDCPFPR